MGYTDTSIREKARIEERPHGLVMTIEVYAGYEGWLSVNERPVTNRGDEAATWLAAHVMVSAHLVNLARELAARRPARLSSLPYGGDVRHESAWVTPGSGFVACSPSSAPIRSR